MHEMLRRVVAGVERGDQARLDKHAAQELRTVNAGALDAGLVVKRRADPGFGDRAHAIALGLFLRAHSLSKNSAASRSAAAVILPAAIFSACDVPSASS